MRRLHLSARDFFWGGGCCAVFWGGGSEAPRKCHVVLCDISLISVDYLIAHFTSFILITKTNYVKKNFGSFVHLHKIKIKDCKILAECLALFFKANFSNIKIA